jgi:hypothetical protein
MDEAFEVLTLMQTGKTRIVPVVLLDRPRGKYWATWMQFLTKRLLKFGFISEDDFAFFKIRHGAQDAVAEITRSTRFFTRRAGWGSATSSAESSLIKRGACRSEQSFQRHSACRRNCPVHCYSQRRRRAGNSRLARLIFTPVRSRFGRFRQLIDAINSSGVS